MLAATKTTSTKPRRRSISAPAETGGYTVVNLGLEYRPLQAVRLFAQVNNVLDREYYTGAQLGSTGFNADGAFVARPFDGPVVDGERPLFGSTFLAPGAPRSLLARRALLVRRRGRQTLTFNQHPRVFLAPKH